MKQLLLSMLFGLGVLFSYAQRTISGRVTDNDGKPLPDVSVQLKGTSTGVTTNADGRFTISADKGTLVFSFTGMDPKEVIIGSGTTINVSLQNADRAMQEVVVTALGIRRNKNTLPYAAQQITGDQLNQTRTSNIASSLSGKISGVEIRQGNGLGGSTNVVIRGTKSLLGNNQALFVIDGVPVDNSNTTNASTASGRRGETNSSPEVGGYDYGNAAADINPDDIESVNVLKGAAASALYGSRAANGVVMITTKKGRKGVGITVNTGVTVGKVDKSTFAKYQKSYGAGYDVSYEDPTKRFFYRDINGSGVKVLITPTTEDASYGAPFDPNLLVYQWDAFDPTSPNYMKARPWVAAANDPIKFFETAVSTNNSVYVDGGNDKTSFKLGYTRTDEKGILPNSNIIKNMMNLGSSHELVKGLVATGAINFTKTNGKGRYGTGYTNYNQMKTFRQWWQTNVDILEQKDAYFRTGKNMTWNLADPPNSLRAIYSDNPYWTRYENYQNDSRYRYFGNASLTYAPTSWLSFLGRISLDSYDEVHQERIAVGSQRPSQYDQYNRTFRELNYDFIATAEKKFNEFSVRGLLGTNIRKTDINALNAITNGGLVVPKIYSLTNSTNSILITEETEQHIAMDGYFTSLTFGYKDIVTLDATGRVDRSSTLPESNNTFFYPSVSTSINLARIIPANNFISSAKLRLNYAEVGNSAPFGSLYDIYDKPPVFGSTTLFSLPNIKNNPDLRPERTKSKEIGLEMAFFKNRLGFDATYYQTNSIDQIFSVAVSTATGYDNKFVNAGNIENKGVEVSLFATPVKTRDFTWNTTINWSRNRNKVLSLYEGASNLQINPFGLQGGVSINATVGQPYGTIQGKTWVWKDGQKLIDNNGYYVITSTTNNVIGNINPEWIGGIQNTFTYKNLSLGFLIDMRKGGDVFSLDLYYGMDSGLYPETASTNDLGNSSRLPIAQGGGVILPGVLADGKPNTKRVENIKSGLYGYSKNPNAAFVYDASYVKLREVNITYSFPATLVSKLKAFKGIDFSLIGRNLWIIHKNLPYSDPEDNITAGNVQGYQSGAYPTTRTIGANLRLKF